MTFIDLFSGIGGFRLGMEKAGHECLGHCEIDKYANKSYKAIHNPKESEWFANDIIRVRADELPRSDCWCFGFPCQDISVAGQQTGFKGSRSSLFFTVTQLIRDTKEEDRPSYLFIENVKNLLSVNRGYDFLKLLIELDEIGYDAEWQVINSADYVPQNRERIFIIGHLRGRGTSKVFPIEETDGKNCIQQIGNFMPTKTRDNPNQGRIYSPDGLAPCLNKMEGGGREPHVALFCDLCANGGFTTTEVSRCLQGRYSKGISANYGGSSGVAMPIGVLRNVRSNYGKQIRKDYEKGDLKISRHSFLEQEIREDGITNTLSTVQKDNLLAIPVLTPDMVNKNQNGRRFKENGEPSFTLTRQDRHGVMVQVSGDLTVYAVWVEKYNCYMAIRKLTPLECFRLQGFPDECFYRAQAVNSDSQLYKQAGNSVTVNVVDEIAKRMKIDKLLAY